MFRVIHVGYSHEINEKHLLRALDHLQKDFFFFFTALEF